MEPIRRRTFAQPDRMVIQEEVIAAVESDPEPFLQAYRAMPDNFGGRYVCSDAFKEMFVQYNASPAHRDRYNAAVHNAAAVLAALQYDYAVADRSEASRSTALFLTGIPGAGKTSSVISTGFPADCRVLFEGQLNRPETSFSKFDGALANGLRVDIVVVHVPPELALERTIQRFEDRGRGATIKAMAEIQGGLPDGLRLLHARYGQALSLSILDNSVSPRMRLQGWQHIQYLEKEGTLDRIAQRLADALEARRAQGLGEAAYAHAAGHPPIG